MSHYFDYDPAVASSPRTVAYTFKGRVYAFQADAGLFSAGHVDAQTDLLLRALPPLSGSLLDLGCGYGCMGIVLASAYRLSLTLSDVNPRAVQLAKENAARCAVTAAAVLSDGFAHVPGAFDTILLNPPIHAGKAVLYRLYEEARLHLNPNGAFYVVIHKKHGAKSTLSKLRALYARVDTVTRHNGCYVFACGV